MRQNVMHPGLMVGAIFSHLFTELGIVVKWDGMDDGGTLFIMAIVALAGSVVYLLKILPPANQIIPTLLFCKVKDEKK